MILRGYIDESYNSEIFTLSCLIGEGAEWLWFTSHWKECLRKWNKKLKAQGRMQLSRYHSADCSNRKGEFEEWTSEEIRLFADDIIKIFKRHPVITIAYTLERDPLTEIFKETAEDIYEYAYRGLIKFLMLEIGNRIFKSSNRSRITLIHDRCAYTTSIQGSFNKMLHDPNFKFKDNFTKIAPMSWEHCIPLQPADLIAYENFKEAQRRLHPRDRRRSLQALFDVGNLGGRARYIDAEALKEIMEILKREQDNKNPPSLAG